MRSLATPCVLCSLLCLAYSDAGATWHEPTAIARQRIWLDGSEFDKDLGPITIQLRLSSDLLLVAGDALFLSILACILFAAYWAIIPGGVVGYTGAVYGSRNLGKIWGLATLIVMGIGPFTGTFVGGWLKDISGVYRYSIMFSLFSFIVAIGFALSLPKKAE